MSPAVELGFGTDAWNAAFYSAMAPLAKTLEAIRNTSASLTLPVRLWNVERQVRQFHRIFEIPVSRIREANPTFVDLGDSRVEMAEKVYSLVSTIERLYENGRQKGLTNRTMTAGSLNALKRHGEEILDLAEYIDLISDPHTEEAFRRASEELRRGETVGLEAIL